MGTVFPVQSITDMKCYHCGENEAEHRFFVNYMGYTGEVHLCNSCVEKFRRYTSAMFQELAKSGAPAQGFWGAPMEAPPVRELGNDPFPEDAGEEFRRRRKLNELRAALERAIEREEYEAAAALRDRICQFEEGVCIYDT